MRVVFFLYLTACFLICTFCADHSNLARFVYASTGYLPTESESEENRNSDESEREMLELFVIAPHSNRQRHWDLSPRSVYRIRLNQFEGNLLSHLGQFYRTTPGSEHAQRFGLGSPLRL